MIAAITLTLGWWIIPAVVTVALFAMAWRDESSSGGGYFSGLSFALMAIPALIVWCAYLFAALLVGIR